MPLPHIRAEEHNIKLWKKFGADLYVQRLLVVISPASSSPAGGTVNCTATTIFDSDITVRRDPNLKACATRPQRNNGELLMSPKTRFLLLSCGFLAAVFSPNDHAAIAYQSAPATAAYEQTLDLLFPQIPGRPSRCALRVRV